MKQVHIKAYQGNCHCGRYRFRVSMPKIDAATACSCSICTKKAYLWLEISADDFTIVKDDGFLISHKSDSVEDRFCGHCGTGVLGEHRRGPLKGKTCINLRTLQGVNPFELDPFVKRVETPEMINSQAESSPSSASEQTFSCHCGKVWAELLVPLSSQQIKEDNCSSCARIGYIGTYPGKDQVRIHGAEHTFEYLYGRKYTGASYCKTCGVHVFGIVHGPPLSVFDSVPVDRREAVMSVYRKNMNVQPLNVRSMNGVDLNLLNITRVDEGTEGYRLD
ncbi:Mss4-like protein [Xylariaceae sp. FL0804]|nr:Mss4-like protein [Xylariaceae sp. FL0804]